MYIYIYMYIYVCVCVYTCICCINGFSNTVSCFKGERSVGSSGGEVWGLKECSFMLEKLA